MTEENAELVHLRKKRDTQESDLRDFLRTAPAIRSQNDTFFFQHNLLHKELAMIFLTKQQLNKDVEMKLDSDLETIYSDSVSKFNKVVKNMNKQNKDHEKAFTRTKEAMRDVVNFRGPAINKTKTEGKQKENTNPKKKTTGLRSRGDKTIQQFVKHVGNVRIIDKGPVQTVVTQTQFNDDMYDLKTIPRKMKDQYKSLEIDLEISIKSNEDHLKTIQDSSSQLIEKLRSMNAEQDKVKEQWTSEINKDQNDIKNRIATLKRDKAVLEGVNRTLSEETLEAKMRSENASKSTKDGYESKKKSLIKNDVNQMKKHSKEVENLNNLYASTQSQGEFQVASASAQLKSVKECYREVKTRQKGQKKTFQFLLEDVQGQVAGYAKYVEELTMLVEEKRFDEIIQILRKEEFGAGTMRECKENVEVLTREIENQQTVLTQMSTARDSRRSNADLNQ